MVEITVPDDLARAIAEAGPIVRLVDSKGNLIGQYLPVETKSEGPIGMTEEHIAELKRRMAEDDGTRYTLAEVKQRLRDLDPDVALALQRMEDAQRGGKFYTTKEVLQHLHAAE